MSNIIRNIEKKELSRCHSSGPMMVGTYRVAKTLGQGSFGKVKRKYKIWSKNFFSWNQWCDKKESRN
jgi:hypothetical protein